MSEVILVSKVKEILKECHIPKETKLNELVARVNSLTEAEIQEFIGVLTHQVVFSEDEGTQGVHCNVAAELCGSAKAAWAVPALVQGLVDNKIFWFAKTCASSLKNMPEEAGAEISRQLKNQKSEVFASALLSTIPQINCTNPDLLEMVMAAAKSNNTYIREGSAAALAVFKDNLQESVPLLSGLAFDTNSYVRKTALCSLISLGDYELRKTNGVGSLAFDALLSTVRVAKKSPETHSAWLEEFKEFLFMSFSSDSPYSTLFSSVSFDTMAELAALSGEKRILQFLEKNLEENIRLLIDPKPGTVKLLSAISTLRDEPKFLELIPALFPSRGSHVTNAIDQLEKIGITNVFAAMFPEEDGRYSPKKLRNVVSAVSASYVLAEYASENPIPNPPEDEIRSVRFCEKLISYSEALLPKIIYEKLLDSTSDDVRLCALKTLVCRANDDEEKFNFAKLVLRNPHSPSALFALDTMVTIDSVLAVQSIMEMRSSGEIQPENAVALLAALNIRLSNNNGSIHQDPSLPDDLKSCVRSAPTADKVLGVSNLVRA